MKLLVFSALLVFKSAVATSHGEEALGPNGGYIRMPGAFHTEVVANSRDLKIFLLDINWKNPSTRDSSVEVAIHQTKTSVNLKCQTADSHFVCTLPKNALLTSGQLTVLAIREKQKGSRATYDLPLALKGDAAEHDDHH